MRLLMAGGVLIAGLFAGANSIANIAADRVPDLALRFWPTHARALTAKAEAQLGRHRTRAAKQLAQEAIQGSALSSGAFQVLGMAELSNSEADDARPYFEYASRLSRRETPTQIWLLQQDLFNGAIQAALLRFDGTMRVSEQSRSSLFPLLAGVIATDGLVAPAIDIFAREPVWLLSFMRYAVRNGSALPNLARIVLALPEDSVARSPEMQAALLRAMVAEERYSEGREFLNAINPQSADGLVRDPSFRGRGKYRPFDWDYADEADLRAVPSGETRGGLRYSAKTGQGGRAARQLIALQPGLHRLTVSGNITSSNSDGGALWRIRCANKTASELVQLPVRNGEASRLTATFTVPLSVCKAQWLELIIEAAFSPGGVQGEVEMVLVESVSPEER